MLSSILGKMIFFSYGFIIVIDSYLFRLEIRSKFIILSLRKLFAEDKILVEKSGLYSFFKNYS